MHTILKVSFTMFILKTYLEFLLFTDHYLWCATQLLFHVVICKTHFGYLTR